MTLESIASSLSRTLGALRFGPPITHVYNPLEYAWAAHREYLRRYGAGPKEVVLVGMNPGPWGMAQTGVPFGELYHVRDFLGIEAPVGKPEREHPRRPVTGFDCTRSEVSGARLWGWVRATFGSPEPFFRRFFVLNYCPLAFFDAQARNVTPDKLPAGDREPLIAACDRALAAAVELLRPRFVVGVGQFAEKRARIALGDVHLTIGRMLHPSPASPRANQGWAEQATRDLSNLGISLSGSATKSESTRGSCPHGARLGSTGSSTL